MSAEILVIPKNGQGHLFPSMELCKHLVLRNYKITLIVDSDISSSIPSSLREYPLFQVLSGNGDMESILSTRDTRPVCAVIDHVMNRNLTVFSKLGIPTVVFITSGACWAAVQHAAWVIRPDDMVPGEVRPLPGLPEEMVLTHSDLKQRRHWIPGPMRGGGHGPKMASDGKPRPPRGPPFPGQLAPWVEEVRSSSAILINTCDDLELPFVNYIADLTGKPVWGIGPLLPDDYWRSSDSLLRERKIRPERESNYTEDEVIGWLDSKAMGSVIYVSFGSEVGPSMEEYPELAGALEETTRPFIWVIQRRNHGFPGPFSSSEGDYFPTGLDCKVGKRGLIIHGWAPQLLILSHQSTGGFVTHCGWNSTVEAIVRGIPLIAWPIRGDQYYNAKLVVSHLKVGCMVSEGYPADVVRKDELVKGIEKALTDEEIRNKSKAVCAKFENGFPASSLAALDAYSDFMNQIQNALVSSIHK